MLYFGKPFTIMLHFLSVYFNGVTIRARWRNGLARLQQWQCYLQGPGFESHIRPVDFFACNKVSLLNSWMPTLTSMPCAPKKLARGCQGLHVKQANKCMLSFTWLALLLITWAGNATSIQSLSKHVIALLL